MFAVGAISALVPTEKTRQASYLFSLLGSIGLLALGLLLTVRTPVSYHVLPVSAIFEFSFRGDSLAGFFIITISLITFAVSLYSLGVSRDLPHAGLAGFFFNVLVLSLYAVALSADLFTFLVSWETMAIS